MGKAFSKNFSEEDKNKLKDEAKMQAASMANELIKRLSSEIEKSARQTMEMLAKSFEQNQLYSILASPSPWKRV